MPSPLVVGEGRRDPGEDGCVWAWGVGEPGLVLVTLPAYLRLRLASSEKVNSMAVTLRAVRSKRSASGRRSAAWSGTVATAPRDRSRWVL